MSATPILQALVLADHVYQDIGTQKFVIAGTFRRLVSPTFPGQLNRKTFAYISLTALNGETPLAIQYVDLRENKVLMKLDFSVQCNDPLVSIEFAVEIPPFPMPHDGVYSFEVVHDNVSLGGLRVEVAKIPEQ